MNNDPVNEKREALATAMAQQARATSQRVLKQAKAAQAEHAKQVRRVSRLAAGGGKHPVGATRKQRDPIAARKRRKTQRNARRVNR